MVISWLRECLGNNCNFSKNCSCSSVLQQSRSRTVSSEHSCALCCWHVNRDHKKGTFLQQYFIVKLIVDVIDHKYFDSMISNPKGSFSTLPCNSRSIALPENIKLFHILRKNLPLYSQKNTGNLLKPENTSQCSLWGQYTCLLQIEKLIRVVILG